MCIFCGGQCGGVGEFLISIGLPFLVLYFSRIKNSLVRLKNRIIHKGQELPAEPLKCGCCDQPLQNCKLIHAQAIDSKDLALLELKSHEGGITKILGVKGWLLLLCLTFTIFIPASYLYQINCVLDLINSPLDNMLLLMFKNLLLYNLATIASMLFLAIFSFYAGLRLWHVKPKAVKTAKVFLIIQLIIILAITIIRPFITVTLETDGEIFREILINLVPSLFQFCLWYLYLSKSRRVYHTYLEVKKVKIDSIPHPLKLPSSIRLT